MPKLDADEKANIVVVVKSAWFAVATVGRYIRGLSPTDNEPKSAAEYAEKVGKQIAKFLDEI